MNIRFKSILLVSLLFLSANKVNANDSDAAISLISNAVRDNGPGVSVAISTDDKPVFHYQKGLANVEFQLPITRETRFNVASVSKQFTAFAILLLAYEGKLSIKDSIFKHLKGMSLENKYPITIEDLLNHTSGIRDMGTLRSMVADTNEVYFRDRFLGILARQAGLNFLPSHTVEYSNSGYFLLARIVENVSQQPFSQFMQKRVFQPLGMNDSAFPLYATSVTQRMADSYQPLSSGYAKSPLITNIDGSTGLITTATDLVKWLKNYKQKTIGNDVIFSQMQARFTAKNGKASTFAKGQEKRIYKGIETWSHGGREASYRSFVMHVPAYNLNIAIVSNNGNFDTAKVAFGLVDIYLKDKLIKTVAKAQPKVAIKDLLGTYQIRPGLIFEIGTDDQKTLYFSELNSAQKSALKQLSTTSFLLDPSRDIALNFKQDANGNTDGFDYQIGLHGAIEAKRLILPRNFQAKHSNDYLGQYYSEELELLITINNNHGELQLNALAHQPVSLTPLSLDVFYLPGNAIAEIEFARNDSGAILGLNASGSLANKLFFKRL